MISLLPCSISSCSRNLSRTLLPSIHRFYACSNIKFSSSFDDWLKSNPLPNINVHEDSLILKSKESPIFKPNHIKDFKSKDDFHTNVKQLDETENNEMCTFPENKAEFELEEEFSAYFENDIVSENTTEFDFEMQTLDNLIAEISTLESNSMKIRRKFPSNQTYNIFLYCLKNGDMEWNPRMQRFIQITSESKEEGERHSLEIIPPLIYLSPLIQNPSSSSQYLDYLREKCSFPSEISKSSLPSPSPFFFALLTSNSVAFGIFLNEKLIKHKIITSYTNRKQQGMSQLKFLRKKNGSSKMSNGAKLRFQQSKKFFNDVLHTFDDWKNDIQNCEILFYSGTVRTWSEVYAIKGCEKVLFRDDKRWIKIPISINKPRMDDLNRMWSIVSHGYIMSSKL